MICAPLVLVAPIPGGCSGYLTGLRCDGATHKTNSMHRWLDVKRFFCGALSEVRALPRLNYIRVFNILRDTAASVRFA